MNDQLTGATGKLGIFGRTLNQINNDLSKGKFASLFHLVPKSEITALQSYGQALLSNSNKIKNWDKALAKGKINQQTYNQTIENTVGSLKGLSTTSQLLGIKIKQLHSDFLADKMSASEFTMQVNTLIGAQKAATVATQVLGTALKTAFNIGIGIAISAIISWIQDLITENQRMAEISKQAADEIKDELNGLEDYSEKIISLRKELESTNTTTERAADVRQELYDIQKDLIENYGAEKDSIDLVTGSIKDQIEELKNLGKQKYDSQYYSNYQATQTTLGNLNNLDLVLDDRAWRDYANQMWQNSNASRFRDDVQDYMKSVLESAGFKYEGGFYKLDGNAFDVNDALVSVEKQVEQAINSLDINDYPNPAAYANAEKQLRHVLEYLSAVNKDVTSPLIEHEEELAQYIKYNEKYSEQYWKLFTARANYEATQERGIQEEIIVARQAFIDTYNGLVIDDGDNAVSWWFEKEFGEVTNESEKAANITVKNLNPIKDKLNELNSAVSEFKETIDTAFSSQSTLQSAFDKIQEGASLSADEVRKLVEICPELAVEFTKTVDGYTISSDALIKANDNIIQSTKESVEAQIKGYQEVIDKYNEIKNAASMPESARQDRLKALGITEDDIKNAEQQINQLRLILSMLGITFGEDASQVEKLKEKYEELSKVGSSLSSKMKSLSSAFKEQKENGELSADTILSIIENGYAAALMYDKETGKVKLNEQAYLNLAKAELTAYEADLQTQISDAELQLLDAKRSIVSNLGWSYLDTAEAALKLAEAEATINNNPELIDNLKGQLLAVQELRSGLGSVVTGEYGDSGSGSSSDSTKDAYTEKQKELKHLLEMEKITQKQYYEMLFGSDEYKALLANRTKYLDELNSIDEEYYKYQQNLYKENADKQFDDLEDQRKRGIITAEQYAQGLHDLGQELYGEDSIYGGTEFAIKALEELDKKVKEVSGDIYSELKDDLSTDGDRLLENVLADVDELSNKNIELFKDTGDLKTFKKNAEDIFETVSKSAQDALERGLITPERYKEIIDKYGKGLDTGIIQDAYDDAFDKIADSGKDKLDKMLITPDEYFKLLDEWGKKLNISKDVIDKLKEAVSESDYLDRWDLDNGYDENKSKDDYDIRAKRIEYIYELAEQLYGKNGQKNLKAYNALINQGLEDVESLVEDYYDAEIKKLEKINDEEEKRQKALELQLNLIKARQKLEEAKKQRNQLIIENGTFRYDYDQEAVLSAQEDTAEAEKAILEQEREDQIKVLEDQKAETLKFFDSVGGKLDDFIDRVEKFLAGDKDAFKVNENKTDVKTNVEVENDNNSSDIKDKNIVSKITDISDVTKDTFNIAKTLADNFSFENLVRALGGNPTVETVKNFKDSYNATLVGKQITPSTLPSNVTNNSSTTNNSAKTVNIGDIHLHLDLTVESLEDFVENKLEQFAQEVGDAFETEILRKMTSN